MNVPNDPAIEKVSFHTCSDGEDDFPTKATTSEGSVGGEIDRFRSLQQFTKHEQESNQSITKTGKYQQQHDGFTESIINSTASSNC